MMGSMMRRAMLGDGSTLNLDFTTMTATADLTARGLTFTRASTTATYINSSGYVTTAGTNVARFDHDPTTLAPRGLLVEGTATNLLQYSEAVDQSPWFTAGTVARATFTGGNGPNGVNNSGSKLSATSISASSSLYYNGITLAAQTYTMSVFAKADGANWIWINVQAGGTIHGAFFDLSGNGALGNTTGTVVSGSNIITKYPNGWFRIQFSFTGTASSWFPVLLPCTSNGTGYASIAGQAPNGVLVYGAQLETGSGASSYIPTGASQATRNADNCELLDLTTMAFNASAGTIYTDVGTRLNTGSQRNYTFLPASGGNNQIFEGSSFALNVYSSGSFVAQIGTSSPLAAQKIAAAYALNDYAVSVAGGAVATDTSGALPSGLTKLTIGGSIINSAAYMGGCIRVFKYWPTRLDNAQLQSLTT
jgi:hypothetical protein